MGAAEASWWMRYSARRLGKADVFFVEEKEITVHTPSDAIANGIALVTEDRKADGFVGGMSIRNNITLASLKDIGGMV